LSAEDVDNLKGWDQAGCAQDVGLRSFLRQSFASSCDNLLSSDNIFVVIDFTSGIHNIWLSILISLKVSIVALSYLILPEFINFTEFDLGRVAVHFYLNL
jgi:hypothetical protein